MVLFGENKCVWREAVTFELTSKTVEPVTLSALGAEYTNLLLKYLVDVHTYLCKRLCTHYLHIYHFCFDEVLFRVSEELGSL